MTTTINKGTFTTLAQVKSVLKKQGHHFFDRDTMRFFNSRIESGLIKSRFFITSESDMRNTERFYNVRMISVISEGECAGEYTINTVGNFNVF